MTPPSSRGAPKRFASSPRTGKASRPFTAAKRPRRRPPAPARARYAARGAGRGSRGDQPRQAARPGARGASSSRFNVADLPPLQRDLARYAREQWRRAPLSPAPGAGAAAACSAVIAASARALSCGFVREILEMRPRFPRSPEMTSARARRDVGEVMELARDLVRVLAVEKELQRFGLARRRIAGRAGARARACWSRQRALAAAGFVAHFARAARSARAPAPPGRAAPGSRPRWRARTPSARRQPRSCDSSASASRFCRASMRPRSCRSSLPFAPAGAAAAQTARGAAASARQQDRARTRRLKRSVTSGLPVISAGCGSPIMREQRRRDVAQRAAVGDLRLAPDVEQRHEIQRVRGVRLPGRGVEHHFGVAVIGGDQHFAADFAHRRRPPRPMHSSSDLDRARGGGEVAGVAHHVAVGVIADDRVIAPRLRSPPPACR